MTDRITSAGDTRVTSAGDTRIVSVSTIQTTAATGFRGLDDAPPPNLWQVVSYLTKIRAVVNGLLQGKLNATLDVTLTASAGSTVINDPRIGGSTAIIIACPLTASAAVEFGAGTIWVSSVGKKTATISHANSSVPDRTFRLVLIG